MSGDVDVLVVLTEEVDLVLMGHVVEVVVLGDVMTNALCCIWLC